MKIWWCQEHEANGLAEKCRVNTDTPCRMVPMRLIPDNTETVERIRNAITPVVQVTIESEDALIAAILAALDGETP